MDSVRDVSQVESSDAHVFRGLQFGQIGSSVEKFFGDRVVYAKISVFDILVGQRIVWISWLLVSATFQDDSYDSLEELQYSNL